MFKLILITILCSVAAPFAGGLIGTAIGGTDRRFNAVLMSYTAGTMISLICFELLHEAVETGTGTGTIAAVTALSAAAIAFIDYEVDRRSGHSHDFITCENCDDEFINDEEHHHCDLEEHAHHRKKTSGLQLLLAGLTTALSVAIHNIPEGMTMGAMFVNAGGNVDRALGVFLVTVVLHNIPEGMAVALPLFTSGMGKAKAAAVAALPGVTAVLGAAAGYAAGEMGPAAMAAALSIAAGTLMYVVFGEILPQSVNLYCSRKTAFAAIAGVLTGLLIIGSHVH